MKKLLVLFILAEMYCTSIFSQSERILKTVAYTIDEHAHPDVEEGQSLTYTLENGGLRIRGYMLIGCCPGIHSMTCLVSDNAIFLSRIDMPWCDCDDWHFVDLSIEGIPEGDYEVFLNQYQCNLESADYAQVSSDAILLVEENDYSLQCTDDQYIITLHTVEIGSDIQAEVFDFVGKKVWEYTSTDNKLYVPSNIEVSFCRITANNEPYFIKFTR